MRAAIVLAAGAGRRFGGAPKSLAPRAGVPLIAHAIAAANAAPVARVLVVVGRQASRVAAVARASPSRVLVVRARNWRKGRSASLAAGTRALLPIERQAFVFLADMPETPRVLARRLLRARAKSGASRPTYRGEPGHPVLLDRAALNLARAGAQIRGSLMATIPADRRCRFDIDRRTALHSQVAALMR